MSVTKKQDLKEIDTAKVTPAIDTAKAPDDKVGTVELTDEQLEEVAGGFGFFANEGIDEGLSRYN
jgi:hypothetical protein